MSTDPDRKQRLRAMLEEDTGSPDDADALLPVIQRLQEWTVPTPDGDPVPQLIEVLIPALPRTETRLSRWQRALETWWPWLLLRSQIRVVRGEIWLASLLIFALGTLVTGLNYDASTSNEHLPFVLAAPLITALGIAYIYGPDVDPPLELMLSMPVSPRLLLLARLTLVFGFNLTLGMLGSISLALTHTELSLWPLVLTWLAPMAFLSALAFFMSVFSREALLSALVSFVLWVMNAAGFPYWLPDLLAASSRPYLLGLALILGGIAVWLAGYEERWVGGHA